MEHTKYLFNKGYEQLRQDYLETFKLMNSGTVKITNENVEKIKTFLETYKDLLYSEGFIYKELEINEISKLFSIANHVYVKACRYLNVQPDDDYLNCIISDVVVDEDVKD